MPYADLFFKDKLLLPVEYLNPFLNLGIIPQIEKGKLAQNAQYLGPLVGMALRQLKNCPIEVNLTPPSVREQAKKSARIPYLVGAVVTALITVAILIVSLQLQLGKVNVVLEARQKEYNRYASLNADIKKATDSFKKSKALLNSLARLQLQRNFWPILMQDLNDRIPDGIWITSLTPMHGKDKLMPLPHSEERGPRRPRFRGGEEEAPAETLNLAPKIQELQICGVVEIRRKGPTSPDEVIELGMEALKEVESFRDALTKSPYIESVDVLDRELPTAQSIGLTFTIMARLKPDKTPDTLP